MSTFEVLTRRPDGHETVHRFAAADAEEAKAQAVEAGVPANQIVDAAVKDGAPEEVRTAPYEPEPEPPAEPEEVGRNAPPVQNRTPEPEPAEPKAKA
jgi:hypothetical protein